MGLAPVGEVDWVLGAVGEDTVPSEPLISAGELLTGLGGFMLPTHCTECLPDHLRQARTWLLAHLGILLCQDILSNCPNSPRHPQCPGGVLPTSASCSPGPGAPQPSQDSGICCICSHQSPPDADAGVLWWEVTAHPSMAPHSRLTAAHANGV